MQSTSRLKWQKRHNAAFFSKENIMKTDYEVPKCCIEGCDNVSNHTDIQYFGEIYRHLCDDCYEEIYPVRDRTPDRPVCVVPGCEKLAHHNNRRIDGSIRYRKYCHVHHLARCHKGKKSKTRKLDDPFLIDDRTHYGDLLPFFS